MGFEELMNEAIKRRNVRDAKFPYKQLDKVFPGTIFQYNASYAILHPWIIVKGICREIKWAWQRVFRGWDNRVLWGVDFYLSRMIPEWLEELKNEKYGVPAKAFGDEEGFSDELLHQKRIEYNKILDEISCGFQSYLLMNDVVKVKYNSPEYLELKKKFDKGFELFHEWFETLDD